MKVSGVDFAYPFCHWISVVCDKGIIDVYSFSKVYKGLIESVSIQC